MVELVATAESIDQAKALVESGVDTLYIGNDEFGLRLPTSFSSEEMEEITTFAHLNGKKVTVAVNAIMHNDRIDKVVPYVQSLIDIGVDAITVGDPGVIHLIQSNNLKIPYIYDAQTLVTSAKHINFWAKRGATGAVLAREITHEELKSIGENVVVPAEVQVYGATCIHHSKRPLVENYYNFTQTAKPEENDLYVSEPKKPETHYSIYEDINGTHVFNTDDINLMPFIRQLRDANLTHWKLDGIYTPGDNFVQIARLFVKAKQAIAENQLTDDVIQQLNEQLLTLHPAERTLDAGFFVKDPDEVQ
ncbi:peptidase U32 family protein [Oceanobacillus halotolerans]|uniref:peptidase U32 family protein n=1 Tax=Oceanobacillus halotolerans TaxID=2663380 RepID=UPI0013D4747C|nr:peptidase U32 family protein [Oceanobacillus halotolerans]